MILSVLRIELMINKYLDAQRQIQNNLVFTGIVKDFIIKLRLRNSINHVYFKSDKEVRHTMHTLQYTCKIILQ